MKEYKPQEVEKKWQDYWDNNQTFIAENDSPKPKYYLLIEFPYPSGSGLHVGHARSHIALDIMARKRRMMGYNVLFPIGWDAFGAPAEQYAIANQIHPKQAVAENIATFKAQVKRMGTSFDWSREFSTTDPDYYKWTQWQFLKFFEHGLAYKAKKNINWCPSCKVGLSNEDSAGGVCERCDSAVEQREKEQWMLRMSDYAEDLIKGLDDTNFQEKIKASQINWIGKSTGAEVVFKTNAEDITVFTTRPDTLFGATFMVIAPEHPLALKAKNVDEVKDYIEKAKNKTEFERTQVNKEKTGVKLEGITATNPANNNVIPIYISDYVMMNYGTGAIMAVPAHDQRDYEFAKKFGIEIIPVLEGGDVSKEAYIADGVHINSGFIDGLNKEDAIEKMLEYLRKNNLGSEKVNYKLQDWVFSRQRFWGEPIPLVHCDKCDWVAVKEQSLPVVLPDVAEYQPTETGESPLAGLPDWVNVPCPKCSAPAKRETDTMPNWAGSSWYWLRYMDAQNPSEFAGMDAMKYWGKVDWYNGGMEHATRHLLYARFWNQFLYNIGLVPYREPFEVRVAHGMVLGENGAKMSKSLGNVVNPDDIVSKFGADTLRAYSMFMGDYEKEVSWSDNGVKGCKRFIDRVIALGEKVIDGNQYSPDLEGIIHKTIKKVTDDIDAMKFNTAFSAMMILSNELDKKEKITKADYRALLTLLNPFIPHITEELNEIHALGPIICESAWPSYDKEKLIDDEIEIAVQVNGKLRGSVIIGNDDDDEIIKQKVLQDENVAKHIENKEIVKIIIVKNRIVNIVVG